MSERVGNGRLRSVILGVSVYNEMPEGWKVAHDGAPAPTGYIRICKGSGPGYTTALLREPKTIGG